jgi:hypothetical protein
MIDVKNKIDTIRKLLNEGDHHQIRYAALECRLALEKICYERLRLAHKYIPLEKVREWQPPMLLKFLVREVEPSLLGGARISISRTPIEKIGELSREDYEAIDYVELGEQAFLNIAKISKLYYKIGSHLHVSMPSMTPEKGDKFFETAKRHVQEVVDELSTISKGSIEFFSPTKVIKFECICGEEILRTEHALQNATVVRCLKPKCRISYAPQQNDHGYELCRRVASIVCPHCDETTKQELADLEHLTIKAHHATNCPSCGGGIKLSPNFEVSKHVG